MESNKWKTPSDKTPPSALRERYILTSPLTIRQVITALTRQLEKADEQAVQLQSALKERAGRAAAQGADLAELQSVLRALKVRHMA
eukprot:1192693-Prorocentrum_minimum.AAC.4